VRRAAKLRLEPRRNRVADGSASPPHSISLARSAGPTSPKAKRKARFIRHDLGLRRCLARTLAVAAIVCTLPAVACSRSPAEPSRPALLPVPLPDLSRAAPSVQEQIRAGHAALTATIDNAAVTSADRAAAYGEMGKLLMAAELSEAAEPCFLNAQALAPDEVRWPYYLGHLYKARGGHAKAAAFFEQALRLRPDDVATLVWLGEMQLAQDQPDAAERSFTNALSHQPRTAAALSGLGRAALARRDHAKAVKYLEDALALDRQAATIHYSLAMAYRGLGERGKAEAHLRQRGTAELLLPDPLMQEISGVLRSAASYESLGIRALEHGEAASATTVFRKGLELAPDSASLHHRLGTALFMTGDARGAMEQFEAALRLSPDFAKAHYSIGVLMASTGRDQEALERFSAAVKYDPGYVEARLLLADMLRHLGRLDEASRHYEQIVAANPRIPEAWLGSAMILVRARRYQQARDRLSEALKVDPDQPEVSNALARLLAAAPDDRVRDGGRAVDVMQPLVTRQPTAEMLETMAMARAELGDYEQAAAWQRKAMDAAAQAGRENDIRQQMAANLELFERRVPCRIPWREGTMP